MELESSVPYSQEPISFHYPKPYESRTHPHTLFVSLKSILIVSSHLCLDFLSVLFPLAFPAKILYSFPVSPLCYVLSVNVVIHILVGIF
jgi:hypothetical protein